MKKRIILIVVLLAVLGVCITLAKNTMLSGGQLFLTGSVIAGNGGMKIGHADISEKGTINGSRGDSTGKEVTICDWYDGGWQICLRPKSTTLAENSADACEEGCANANIGYGQADRNSAYQSYKASCKMSQIEKSNVDDSSFMTLCAIAGGCKNLEYKGNAPTTSTMRKAFEATGDYEVLRDEKYLTTTEYLRRGDILVKEGGHTVMVLTNGKKANKKR